MTKDTSRLVIANHKLVTWCILQKRTREENEIIILICMNQLYLGCILKCKPFNRLYLLMRPRERYFILFSKTSIQAVGPIQPLIRWVPELFPGIKRPGNKAGHSHPSSDEGVSGAYTSTPSIYVFLMCAGITLLIPAYGRYQRKCRVVQWFK